MEGALTMSMAINDNRSDTSRFTRLGSLPDILSTNSTRTSPIRKSKENIVEIFSIPSTPMLLAKPVRRDR